MNRKATSNLLWGVLAVLVISAVFAGSAGASPAWNFEAKALTGTETVVGGAEKSAMTVPGMTTTCDNFLYNIAISNNKSGVGEGSLKEVPLFNCYTNGVCTVDAIAAIKLPWATNLTTVKTVNYIFIKGIEVEILYGGEDCVLNETIVLVKGTAGGSLDNKTESATFNSTTFKETGAKLESFGSVIEWTGVFPTEAFEWHRGQALSVS